MWIHGDLQPGNLVVDGGRLVGVVSRAVLQRRLAEDEEPAAEDP